MTNVETQEGLRSGADARRLGMVPQYADHMKARLLAIGQSEEQAEEARQKILRQFDNDV